MSTRRRFLIAGSLVALTVLAIPESLVAQNTGFNGQWILNLDESEDGHVKFQAAIREARASGMGGGGRRPPPGAGGGNRGSMQETLRMLVNGAMRLNITVDDSTVTVVTAEGSRMMFYPDGRKIETSVEGAGTIETKAQWKGNKLVVERKTEGGMKITSNYELKSDGTKLHVKMKFEGGRLPVKVEVLRVYDAGSGAG
jgi:hypothetical protein